MSCNWNSIDLTNKLKNLDISNQKYKLVSFDISNMFTNIPTEECIPLIQNIMDKKKISPLIKSELLELLKLCLEQNYCTFGNNIYLQETGLPMGSPLSPILSDIYMDNFEENILKTQLSNKHILFWFRYVDDILVGFKGTDRQIDSFLQFLNSENPRIQFTLEIEENRSINFLDLNITHSNTGLTFKVYRKPTFSDATIPADSCSPWPHKLAAYQSMIHRALHIPMSQQNRNEELDIIRTIAKNNGFKISDINKLINKKRRKMAQQLIYPHITENNQRKKYIALPFLPSISIKIGNSFKKEEIIPAFKNSGTLKNIFFNAKSTTNKNKKCGVYKLKCQECSATYVGQTGRSFQTRIAEHLSGQQFSHFKEHLEETGHRINRNNFNFDILHTCHKGKLLDLFEILEINRIIKDNNIQVLNSQIDFNKSPLLNLDIK